MGCPKMRNNSRKYLSLVIVRKVELSSNHVNEDYRDYRF